MRKIEQRLFGKRIIKVRGVTPTALNKVDRRGGWTYSYCHMEVLDPLARDFILFCVHRKGREWPALYDEMCWVAGRRLFQGLGYNELKKRGLSLGLTKIEDTIRLVDMVTAQQAGDAEA